MALTINGFLGAETGGTEEFFAVSNIGADASVKRTGSYSYKTTAGAVNLNTIRFFQEVASAGTGFIAGFWYRTQATAFSGYVQIFDLEDADGTAGDFFLLQATNGTLVLQDSTATAVITSAALSVNTWYFVELYVERVDSGAAELFIDGVSAGQTSAKDFNRVTVTPYRCVLYTDAAASESLYWDNIYFMSGATSAAERLGGCEVFSYRSNVNAVTADAGTNLASGTWLGAQEVPFSDATIATYTVNPSAGSVNTNDVGGSAGTGGPLTDRNISGSIKAVKGIWRALRGGGGATSHYALLGNSVDGTTRSAALALSVAYEYRFMVSELSTIVPLRTEIGRIGFETAGAQDISVADMLFQILHVPGSLPVYSPAYKMQPLLQM